MREELPLRPVQYVMKQGGLVVEEVGDVGDGEMRLLMSRVVARD